MAAVIGYGTILEVAALATPTAFVAVGSIIDLKPMGLKGDSVDATTFSSAMLGSTPMREKIPGLGDLTNPTFKVLWNFGDATDVQLRGLFQVMSVWRITTPSGARWVCNGFLMEYQPETPIDNKMAASCAIETTSVPVFSASAAPVNLVLPAVSGLLANGNVLTAYPGSWSGAPAFTYQWKKGGTNIGGATNATYTTVAGDVGGIITVAVTGTNTVGNATATSSNLGAIT